VNGLRLPIVASTMTNACGIGSRTVWEALTENRSGLRRFDLDWAESIETWVGRVDALEAVRLPQRLVARDSRSNRLAWISLEQDGFRDAVAAAVARHGPDRIGLFVGTTTSGVLSTELAYRDWARAEAQRRSASPALRREIHRMHATTAMIRDELGLRGPTHTVSTACSSSAKVFAAAARFITAGWCAAAVVGGVDSLTLSTLFGFRALDLVSARPCRPFAADRDGISIGEAAGFALIDPHQDSPTALIGYGESSDAWHMSSPHPEGAGAAQAMRAALAMAELEPEAVGYVNLHGTASRANDVAEDRAITSVFGRTTPVSSTKGFTGHTLGAAGITEALFTVRSLVEQWLPGTIHCDAIDPALGAAVMRASRPSAIEVAMSNSFGFGGSNCALLFGRTR
jgi:3-oxoacyl-[acyl-carrier-protein] synthase-1